MKKRSFITILTLLILIFCMTACQENGSDGISINDQDNTIMNDDSNRKDSIENNDDIEKNADSDDDIVFSEDNNDADQDVSEENSMEEAVSEDTTTEATIEETEVVPAPCSLCGEAKDCDVYEVDGKKYLVCDYCYPEFAGAFGLED